MLRTIDTILCGKDENRNYSGYVTNPNGTPFNVNMQQTPTIKIGSYAPLDNTIFQITPFC